MKTSFAALTMTFCIALTGCYGVSQEEYNSVVSQNIELQSQNEQLQAELKEADEAIEQSQRELNEANSQQEDAEIKETEDTENYIQYVTPNGQIGSLTMLLSENVLPQ